MSFRSRALRATASSESAFHAGSARGLSKVVCGTDTLGVFTRTLMEEKFRSLVKLSAMTLFGPA
jgi:hypothetical protein